MPGLQHGKRPSGARVAKSDASETKDWQPQVMGLAVQYGWRVAHFHDSRRQVTRGGATFMVGDEDARGWPDLSMAHHRYGLAFVELKTDQTASKPTKAQLAWLRALAAGTHAAFEGDTVRADTGKVIVHVWRPRDLATIVLPVLQGRPRDVPRFYGFEVPV